MTLPQISALPWLLLALPLLAAVDVAKAVRWWALIGYGRPDLARCLRALVSGQLANALAPVRGGEVLSVGLLKVEGGPLLAGGVALAGSKALDAPVLALFAAWLIGSAAWDRSRLGLIAALTLVLIGAGLALLRPSWRERLTSRPLVRKLHLAELLKVAGSLREPRVLLAVAGSLAVVWLAGLAANGAVLLAAGAAPDLRLMAGILVAGYVTGLLPAPPGRIGTFEAGVVAALTAGGVALPRALQAAVALHLCQWCELGLLLGGSVLWSRAVGAGRRSTLRREAG